MTDQNSYEWAAPRLYVSQTLQADTHLIVDADKINYLKNVLRLGANAPVLVFNGQDGEWLAHFQMTGKRDAQLHLVQQVREQIALADVWYLFAPIKHARLDYMVQKAVEMGAGRLQPIMTQRTQMTRVNLERMSANVVEAAEQCGILAVPQVMPPLSFAQMLDQWDPARRLIFCDEDAAQADPIAQLRSLVASRDVALPLAVLIGPEGGFDAQERARLLRQPFVTSLSLGPRILRADTAAIAALTVVQAVLGDWGRKG